MITKTKVAVIVSRLLKNKEAALCRFCIERCPHEQCESGMCKEFASYHEELIEKINKKKRLLAEKVKMVNGGKK